MGGDKLQPFLIMIDSGRKEVVFQDMNNLFCYANLRAKARILLK